MVFWNANASRRRVTSIMTRALFVVFRVREESDSDIVSELNL